MLDGCQPHLITGNNAAHLLRHQANPDIQILIISMPPRHTTFILYLLFYVILNLLRRSEASAAFHYKFRCVFNFLFWLRRSALENTLLLHIIQLAAIFTTTKPCSGITAFCEKRTPLGRIYFRHHRDLLVTIPLSQRDYSGICYLLWRKENGDPNCTKVSQLKKIINRITRSFKEVLLREMEL